MTNKRILVTGARGFIGRHVVPLLLERGYIVYAVGRKMPEASGSGAQWHEVDLFDAAKCRALLSELKPRSMLHLAWNATPGRFWHDPDNLDWVAASLTLTRAFADNGGQRAVFAGTCAEYDWNFSTLDEQSTPLRPHTLYGHAKKTLCELLIAAAPKLGLSMAWGRIFFLYGNGEASGRLVSDVIAALLRGEPALCSEGSQQRDFMHVEDVARAFVELLETAVTGPVNIASGQSRPLRDLVLRIGECLDRTELIQLGARPLQAGEPAELNAVTRRLNQEVGFTPRYSLDEGIASVCARALHADAGQAVDNYTSARHAP
ncbi:MAG: NAD-dependent epimerase/dehydratase family protein [Alcaligenaceae bacterium]|nr:MAG: NAD-dependent epimerase/dehydratase family protein [Alcaligenaceae bacterium]